MSDVMARVDVATPPGTRAMQLLEAIEERIVAGDFPPGGRLDEVGLAEAFGVSRTPIREALFRLSAIGMVDRIRKGWQVAEISDRRLFELFEFMAELEALCGRLAAGRGSAFEHQRLRACHDACGGVSDPDLYYRRNAEFHDALYRASGNEFLIEQVRTMQRRGAPYRRLQLRAPARIAESFAEHAAIVDAVEARDEERAAALLRRHVALQGARFTHLLERVEDWSSAARPGGP